MYLQTTFELSMCLDSENFHKILTTLNYLEETEEGYIDQSMASKGIVVTFRESQYKKRVWLLVNERILMDSEEPNSDKLIRKLEKLVDKYFDSKYQLDDFDLTGMVLTTDINVRRRENVLAYLKVLWRVGKIKGFAPTNYECFDDITSFCLAGNSNGINFLLYDLEGLLTSRLRNTESNRKKLKSITQGANGILRAEIRLSKTKAIRAYTDETDVSEQIAALSEKSKDIFMGTFVQAVPFGDFHKKDKAVEVIRREVKDVILRRRMLQLVTLIPEKKSLLLAQKALNSRQIDDIMKVFVAIDLSPVTISKRHDIKHLENLYTYL